MRGNLHAAFDVAGAGNGAWSRWCDTLRRKGEPTGNTNFDLNRRVSPRPYRQEDGPGLQFSLLRLCRLRCFARRPLIHQSPTTEVLRGGGAFAAIESKLRSVAPSDTCSTMQPRHRSVESRDDEYGRAGR